MKHHCWRPAKLCFALAVLPILTVGATAQIAVSANDNKAVLVNGANVVPDTPAADTVSIIDLGASPPKVIGEVKAPASVVGPPQSVAISRDESFALVTGAFKFDPTNAKKAIPDNRLSVIDLKAKPPAVIATLDRPAVLRRTLQSLATSDSVPAELIVIDASSDTQTEEMLKKWDKMYLNILH